MNPYTHIQADALVKAASTIRFLDKVEFVLIGHQLHLSLGENYYTPMGVTGASQEQANELTKAFKAILEPTRQHAFSMLEDVLKNK